MFCTTVIPTVGRTTLARSVESVLGQHLADDDYQVIVVNDSGEPLAAASWQQDARVQVVTTNQHERSIARNTGAALGHGRYLHFLDDDDWLVPGAFESLYHCAATYPDADWLYGVTQLVDRGAKPLLQLHHAISGNGFVQTMSGEWIPLQASFIRSKAFFAVGGFNPLIAGPEDVDLLRRIALQGDLAGTAAVVACVGMGEATSTTNYQQHAERSRWAREHIFEQPGVYSRLRSSATNGYWQGRIVRAYLTSGAWNLRRGRLFTTASRALFAAASMASAARHLADAEFWRAVSSNYRSPTFAQGKREAGSQIAYEPLEYANSGQ